MRHTHTRADWLVEQSQEHFQKLASLAIRAEGAQQMGKLAAHQNHSSVISNVGRINFDLEKDAALGAVSAVASGAKKAVGAVKSVVSGGKSAVKAPAAVPKLPSPASAVQTPAAGGAASMARPPQVAGPQPTPKLRNSMYQQAPAQSSVAQTPAAGGAVSQVRAPSAVAPPARQPIGQTTPQPAANTYQINPGDSQNITTAKRLAELKGVSPTDEYARLLEAAGYGTGMGAKSSASAAKSAIGTRGIAPKPAMAASAPAAAPPAPIQSSVGQVAGGQQAASVAPAVSSPQIPSTMHVAPAPAQSSIGRVSGAAPTSPAAGPYHSPSPGQVAPTPQPMGLPPADSALGRVQAAPTAPAAPAAAPSATDAAVAATDAAKPVGRRGGLLLPAGLLGGGLALGGTALGVAQFGSASVQNSNLPYSYGRGSPMPGMYAQQM